tara:strand:+ start:5913 stop:6071 length:159 start_codon:yes stop_codon:yes gene_type:complete
MPKTLTKAQQKIVINASTNFSNYMKDIKELTHDQRKELLKEFIDAYCTEITK